MEALEPLKTFIRSRYDHDARFIVRIAYKYDFEGSYDEINIILEYDTCEGFTWEWDWYEGQQHVFVMWFVDIDDIGTSAHFIKGV